MGEELEVHHHKETLQVLICSANLGNASIDEASFCHWIPADGLCREVVVPEPKYPLQFAPKGSTPSKQPDPVPEYTETDRFDVIVFGLQESTFDPPKQPESAASIDVESSGELDNNNNNNSIGSSSNHHLAALLASASPTSKKLSEPLIGAGGYLVKNTKKTITQIQNITTSRDYTKRGSDTGMSPTQLLGNIAGFPFPTWSPASTEFNHQNSTTSSSGPTTTTTTITTEQVNGGTSQHSTVSSPTTATAGAAWQGGTHLLHHIMQWRLPSYGRMVSFQRGEMRLVVWVHQDIRDDVQVVHVSAQNTGRAGLANKGGIVAELVYQNTRIALVTAHLEAHEGASKYAQRVTTLADILAGTKQKNHDVTLTSHYCFVMGDLNFRTELPNHAELDEEQHKRIVRDMVERRDWQALNEIDELGRALRNQECLVGFQTPLCWFPPTFKVERQPGYVYVDKRRPSYTDRILWKTGHGLQQRLQPLVYEPVDDFASSDHKPVRAAFAVQLNQPFQLKPQMARRRPVLNVGKMLHKKKRDKHQVAVYTERFHLFVSDFLCRIASEGKSSSNPPSLYLCLSSDPPDALQQTVPHSWKKVRHAVRQIKHLPLKAITLNNYNKKRRARLDTSAMVTAKGWPRSSCQKQTFVGNWPKEEIHCEIKTHTADGIPIDLTGAVLRLTVMDSRQSGVEDVVLGTYTFNLVELMRSCRPTDGASSRANTARSVRPSRYASVRGSLMGRVFHQTPSATDRHSSHSNVVVAEDLSEEHDPIATVEIDEPLLKNGTITGQIQAKIEVWWMDERMAKTLTGDSSRASTRFASNASINGVALGEGGSASLLSNREARFAAHRKHSQAQKNQ